MQKSINSIRVSVNNWLYEDRFQKLIDILKVYPAEIGQIALFTQDYHTPMPIEQLKRLAEIMKLRMEELRKHGFSAGINILCTIGHHNENLTGCYSDNSYRITNIKGEMCEGSHCMRDSRYLENYIKPVYIALAKANPEFIWIDDDVRCDHMPIGRGCFCDLCIADFNKKYGYSYKREELREQLNGMNITLRKQWLDQNRDGVKYILEYIGKTVRGISPDIILGFMTCQRYFEGYDFKSIAEALSENGKYEIMWRPGGGVYTDYSIEEFLNKLRDIGIQNANLPEYITVIQSEIENFPYQLIKKGPFFTALEGLLYMTAGCTGTAFNILPGETLEPIENSVAHIREINNKSAEYRVFSEKLAGLEPFGISIYQNRDIMAYTCGEWADSYPNLPQTELFNFGLPESYKKENSLCTILNEFSASSLSDNELKAVLSKGVYLDASALNVINSRGFSEYTGFDMGKEIPTDAIERYLPVSFNEGIEGKIRNCRQAFNFGPSVSIVPNSRYAIPICELVDYQGNKLADCSMGVFENKLGGRVAVGGYYPFSWISDSNKSKELIRVFDYLSGNKLPAFVNGYARLKTTAFSNGKKLCVTLFNPSPDTLENIPVCVFTNSEKAVAWSEGKETKLGLNKKVANYSEFIVHEIEPYGIILLEICE